MIDTYRMARRKPKPEKIIQEKIKETLDSIVDAEIFNIESLTNVDLPRLKNSVMLDFDDERLSAGSNANALLDKMVDFYLDADLIGEDEHIDYKKKMDSMNLASMLLQLRTSQHTIIKIMEEIDLGNMNPKLIDSLVQLQNQIMKMPKDYQDYMGRMEDSYKQMKTDFEQKKIRGGVILDEEESTENPGNTKKTTGIRVRGNKGLMEGLRDLLGSEIEDVTIDDLDSQAVVNAKQKLNIDKDRNFNPDETDSGEFRIDDDLFNN